MIKTAAGKDAKKSQPIAMYGSDVDYLTDQTRKVEKQEQRKNVSMSEYVERLVIRDQIAQQRAQSDPRLAKTLAEIEEEVRDQIKKRRARR